jgi:hypothetical protein
MKWISVLKLMGTLLLCAFYVGGIIGSYGSFKGGRPCGSDILCNFAVFTNAVTWPLAMGSELARWAYERERARLHSDGG